MNIAQIRSRLPGGHAARPSQPRLNDVFIVEFPKSGITWLSMLLANMSLAESGLAERATYGSINQYVPDLHMNADFGDLPYHRPNVRLIKSHAEYDPSYIMTIYLVRHPLAVMKSYFNFARAFEGDQVEDIATFVRSEKKGIPAWKRHVHSWLGGKTGASRVLTVRYEDLVADTEAQLARISDTYGWHMSNASMEEAIRLCTVERMQAGESNLHTGKLHEGKVFVKSGAKTEISPEVEAYIRESCASELAALGYD